MLREKKLCSHRFKLNNIVSSLPWISELCEDIVVVLLPLLHQGGRVCHNAPLWYLWTPLQEPPGGRKAGSRLPVQPRAPCRRNVACCCSPLFAPSTQEFPDAASNAGLWNQQNFCTCAMTIGRVKLLTCWPLH